LFCPAQEEGRAERKHIVDEAGGAKSLRTIATVAAGLLWLGVVCTVASGGAQPRQNLLTNGGFEGALGADGVPEGWQAYGGGAPDTAARIARPAHGGRQALLISDHNPAAEVGVSQTASLPAGAKYLLASVWVRGAEGGRGVGGFLQLRFLPSQQYVQVELRGGTGGWQQCRAAGVAPEGTTSIVLYLYTHRETLCDVLLDDAEVVAVSSLEELLEASDVIDLSGFPPPPVTKLKELYLDTAIVREGRPAAWVVVPAEGRYDALAQRIVQAVAQKTGARLPIKRDREVALPLAENAIILGNRSTNDLIRRLYDLYYTYLDLKYPGRGGWEVRSLHNPFGNGRNAILVGSSDDAGMAQAVDEFIRLAAEAVRGKSLVLGWTMRIKLGAGLTPPADPDQVPSWNDSVMYAPGTYFGWNALSRRLALYYMTGEEKYLQDFLRLAFPDQEAKQFLWKVDGERIEDKDHPLSGPYHYNAMHMILLWDLVEESPFFTNEQRLRVTQAFAEQLRHWQQEWCYAGRRYGDPNVLVGSRHDQWAAVSLYCLSRYFATYYPHPVWRKNLAAAAHAFSSLARTFYVVGEFDHLYWYTTGLEPLLTYMVLSGDRRGLENGNLDVLLRGYDLLVDGVKDGENLRGLSLSFAHLATYLTGDGRFLYYRDLTSLDTNVFRIGQSFWPTIPPRAPTEQIGTAAARPLSREEWQEKALAVPLKEAFQFAAYRSGLTDHDDYLLLDGYYGGSRNPYHCLALTKLRLGDRVLLDGYLSQVVVRVGGLTEARVPLGAGLKRCVGLRRGCYFEAQVPDFSFGAWRRRLLHLSGRWTLVLDEFQAREDAPDLEIAVQWQLPSRPTATEDGRITFKVGDMQAAIIPWAGLPVKLEGHIATVYLRRPVKKTEIVRVGTLIGLQPQGRPLSCAQYEDQPVAVIFEGGEPTVAWLEGQPRWAGREGMYAHVGPGAAGLLSADPGADAFWDFGAGEVEVSCGGRTELGLAVEEGQRLRVDGQVVRPVRRGPGRLWVRLGAGRHVIAGAQPQVQAVQELAEEVRRIAAAAQRPALAAQAEEPRVAELTPRVKAVVEGAGGEAAEVRALLKGASAAGACVYAITARHAYPIARDGSVASALEPGTQITAATYWPEAGLLLLGGQDDKVYAYAPDGRLQWTFQSVMHPDLYATGKTYWFKEALPGISGLATGNLTGQGTQAFVGSACTVEILDPTGRLIQRVPQYWGSVWRMAVLEAPDGRRMLLAAKMPNGVNDIGIIDGQNWTVTYGFTALPPGHTFVSGWSAMNTPYLEVADLDGDGRQEVVLVVSGSWNRLVVYEADGRVRWAQSFGPWLNYARYMRGLAVADLDGDGKREVIAAAQDGIVAAFTATGERMWTLRLAVPAWTLAALRSGEGRVVVAAGCEDGAVRLIDAGGRLIAKAQLDGRVTALLAGGERAEAGLWAGTARGTVAHLPLP
jgi:hypothetical protein